MATAIQSVNRAQSERRFFGTVAIAFVLVTFAGFAPTYYLSAYTGAPTLTRLVHAHGVVFSAWILLYAWQAALIGAGRADIHRVTGIAGAGLAILVVLLGIAVAIVSGQLRSGPPDRNHPVFLVNPLTNISAFAILAGLGIARRNRAQDHKRYMLLATMALAVTPLARVSRMLGAPVPLPIGGMMLSNLFLVALVIHDLRTRGRLHPVTMWAGGALLASEPLRVIVSHTAAWQAFARMLIG